MSGPSEGYVAFALSRDQWMVSGCYLNAWKPKEWVPVASSARGAKFALWLRTQMQKGQSRRAFLTL